MPVPFRFDNKTRLLFDGFTLHGLHAEADTTRKSKRTSRSWALQDGPLAAQVEWKRISGSFLAASLKASAESRQWWFPGEFGLKGQDSAVLRFRIPGFSRGLTGSMTEPWWTKPFFPKSPSRIPPLTQFLIWREKDGSYGVFLPLSGGDAVSFLRGVPGGLELSSSIQWDGLHRMQAPLFALGFGKDPHRLVQDAYRAAAKWMGKTQVLRENKKYPSPSSIWAGVPGMLFIGVSRPRVS